MRRLWLLAPLCVAGLLWSGFLMGEGKKADKEPVIVNARLPQYYSRLDLSRKQRNEILKIRGKYGAEIQALYQKINDLRDQERTACEDVLTDAQKARLREILLGSDKRRNREEKDTEVNNKKKDTVAKDKKKAPAAKDKKIEKATKEKPEPVEIKK